MKQRCFNLKHARFEQYGGRGITVCAQWAHSFATFWRDMGATWFDGAELDRIDGAGHYNRQNCHWLTCEEHSRKSHQDTPRKRKPKRSEYFPAPDSSPPRQVEQQIFDLQGAADYLQKSRRWLRESCASLGIEHERIGRGFRFTRRELDRFLAQHRRQGRAGVYAS